MNAHGSGGPVMGYRIPFLFHLALEVWLSFVTGQNPCGHFSYHPHAGLDDKTFSQDGLPVKVYTVERALVECSSDCFYDTDCNMFVLKPTSGECRMYKRSFFDSTLAASASGFRYYGASCSVYKSSTPQCQTGFSLYGGTTSAGAHCYSADGLWVAAGGSSSQVCKQDEWIDTTEVSIPLPAPIVPGVTIDIRGSRKTNSELFTALRQHGSNKETNLLRVMPSEQVLFGVFDGTTWLSSPSIPNFAVAPEVVFDLNVVVTDNEFKVKVNGDLLISIAVGNPLNVSTFIQMFYWRSVERIKLTYP